MDYIGILIIYFIGINLISFFMFYSDKKKAKKDRRRIRERTLHISSFMGGSIGSIAAMYLFHHKTKKIKFCLITFAALIFNVLILYGLLNMII